MTVSGSSPDNSLAAQPQPVIPQEEENTLYDKIEQYLLSKVDFEDRDSARYHVYDAMSLAAAELEAKDIKIAHLQSERDALFSDNANNSMNLDHCTELLQAKDATIAEQGKEIAELKGTIEHITGIAEVSNRQYYEQISKKQQEIERLRGLLEKEFTVKALNEWAEQVIEGKYHGSHEQYLSDYLKDAKQTHNL